MNKEKWTKYNTSECGVYNVQEKQIQEGHDVPESLT